MTMKSDVSGSVWDWQLGTRTLLDGTELALGTSLSFRVWFEDQLIRGQEPGADYFHVFKIKTGPVGYIQFFLDNLDKLPLVDSQGNVVRSTYHGRVKLTWEEEEWNDEQ